MQHGIIELEGFHLAAGIPYTQVCVVSRQNCPFAREAVEFRRVGAGYSDKVVNRDAPLFNAFE